MTQLPALENSIDQVQKNAVDILSAANISDASAEALLLWDYARTRYFGISHETKCDYYLQLVEARSRHVPLSYLTGIAKVSGIDFEVGPGAFVPRKETELYVARATEMLSSSEAPKIIDLCSGVGTAAFILKHNFPNADVVAVELDEHSLIYARRNQIARLASGDLPVRQIQADITDVDLLRNEVATFDLVIANPPYVPLTQNIPAEWSTHQPRLAIYSEDDGFATIRASIDTACRLLKLGGYLLLEHGDPQGPLIAKYLSEHGYKDTVTHLDKAGRPRWTEARFCGQDANSQHVVVKPINPPRRTWFHDRIERTGDWLDRCFSEGLTGHTFVAREGKEVELNDGTTVTEFVSCSYLGFEQRDELVNAVKAAADRFGAHFSSSRNRMRPIYLSQLDDALGEIHGGMKCVSFTSVSSVHLGVLPVLAAGGLPSFPIEEGGPYFIIERTAHASMQILRGILQQFGPCARFSVVDDDTLLQQLALAKRSQRTPIVLTDGIGSMGGLADVRHLLHLIREFQGILYVDDAHGTSISGSRGQGYAANELEEDLQGVVLVGSLSKGFGGSGGYVVLPNSSDVISIRKAANPLVFGHSIMLPLLAADVESAKLHLSGVAERQQVSLRANLATVDKLTHDCLENHGTISPIRSLTIPSETKAYQSIKFLRDRGIVILPAFYPTVSKGSGLLRFAVSATHTQSQLENAADVISELVRSENDEAH